MASVFIAEKVYKSFYFTDYSVPEEVVAPPRPERLGQNKKKSKGNI